VQIIEDVPKLVLHSNLSQLDIGPDAQYFSFGVAHLEGRQYKLGVDDVL
jgi:hypothetical protein